MTATRLQNNGLIDLLEIMLLKSPEVYFGLRAWFTRRKGEQSSMNILGAQAPKRLLSLADEFTNFRYRVRNLYSNSLADWLPGIRTDDIREVNQSDA